MPANTIKPNINPAGSLAAENDVKKELKEQKEILLKIYEQTQKTRRYIMIGKIISFIYLLLLVVPIIFAAIYLPPLLKNVIAPYQELLGQTNSSGNSALNTNKINNLLKQFAK